MDYTLMTIAEIRKEEKQLKAIRSAFATRGDKWGQAHMNDQLVKLNKAATYKHPAIRISL